MLFHDDAASMIPENYSGKILTRECSQELKQEILTCIESFQAVERTGVPVMTYISAWRENEKIIWYEYAGRRLTELLGCRAAEVADIFRQSVLDRREYRYTDVATEVQEEIITRQELNICRQGLREKVKKSGRVEAIYKVVLQNQRAVWLKDRATVKVFAGDGVFVSLGHLTDVTKEMEQKDLLQKIGYFDELTRLPKRNIMQMLLEMSFGQMEKKLINNFSFLMLDIDNFEALTSRYGGQAGDQALTAVAELLTVSKRKEDEVGRYGDEGFYALSHGDIGSGRELAGRLRKIIEQVPLLLDGEPVPLTVSIGVVAATELEKLNIDLLVIWANKRLRAAKKKGGNRVVWGDAC